MLTGPGDRRLGMPHTVKGTAAGESGGSAGRVQARAFAGVSVGRQGRAGETFSIGCRNRPGGLWTVEVVPSCLKSGPGTFKCLVAQSCLTLCNTIDCSPPGSSVRGFPRHEYCSGVLFSTPGNLPDPGMEPISFASPVLLGMFFPTSHLGSLRDI